MPAEQPTCATCRWWHERNPTMDRTGREGLCFRFPPVVIARDSCALPVRPLVYTDDWCGEHAPVAPAKESPHAR